jgi:hypothetical protein
MGLPYSVVLFYGQTPFDRYSRDNLGHNTVVGMAVAAGNIGHAVAFRGGDVTQTDLTQTDLT